MWVGVRVGVSVSVSGDSFSKWTQSSEIYE